MIPGHFVAAHRTQFLDNVFGVRIVRGAGHRSGDDPDLPEPRMANIPGRNYLARTADTLGRVPRGVRRGVGRQRVPVPGVATGIQSAVARRGIPSACGRKQTGVDFFVAAGGVVALEESLAGLARQKPVLVPGHFVAAHGTPLLERDRVEEGRFEPQDISRLVLVLVGVLALIGVSRALALRALGLLAHCRWGTLCAATVRGGV